MQLLFVTETVGELKSDVAVVDGTTDGGYIVSEALHRWRQRDPHTECCGRPC
jgi:hypothetical protein